MSQIHDLGYARYEGKRTPVKLRFWVIAENVIRLAIRKRFQVQLPLVFSLGVVFTVSVVMYFTRFTLKDLAHGPFGSFLPKEDVITVFSLEALRMMGFVLSLTVASTAVSEDLRQGAFQFYFSRAIRRRDYVLGKLLGVSLVVGVPLLACPLLLSIVRLFFAENLGAALGELHLIARALVFGAVATVSLSLIPLGISAAIGQRRLAQIAWALFYLVLGQAAEISARQLDVPEVLLISVAADVRQLGAWIYGVNLPYGMVPWAGPVVLGGLALAGLWILRRRVSALESADLGGA